MNEQGTVLVADDDPQMQLALKASLSRAGYDVHVVGDGSQALEKVLTGSYDLVVSDQRMPGLTGQELLEKLQQEGSQVPFLMITAHGTISQAVEAMQAGAADFITKPFSLEDLLQVVERILSPERREFRLQKKGKARAGRPIVTQDRTMIRILEVAEAVARSDATVLVQGESGTGKELIARLIHSASPRSEQPFVAVNCAALPDSLLESELFGHEKGSFTGAQARKIGKFELAHGGTILLDEISEMELPLQAKLLRVLQEREVDRVGGRDPVTIDVRVVATTNRNLEHAVQAGQFRADLFYRLNVIPITLPPLRARKGDVPLLARHFMRHHLRQDNLEIPDQVLRTLLDYDWPGNVRELQNAVERAAILAGGRVPSSRDFLLNGTGLVSEGPSLASKVEVRTGEDPVAVDADEEEGMRIRCGMTVHDMERNLILETLRSVDNNRTQAAKLLGISIRTLRNKLHEYRGEGFPIAAE